MPKWNALSHPETKSDNSCYNSVLIEFMRPGERASRRKKREETSARSQLRENESNPDILGTSTAPLAFCHGGVYCLDTSSGRRCLHIILGHRFQKHSDLLRSCYIQGQRVRGVGMCMFQKRDASRGTPQRELSIIARRAEKVESSPF